MTGRAPPKDKGVDRLLADLDPGLGAIARRLRATIRSTAPALVERVKWGSPVWEGRTHVLCLMLYEDHVNLGLFRGAQLAPRHPEIEGTGRSLRHVKVRSMEEAARPVLRTLIREAVREDLRADGEPRPRRRTTRPC